MEVGVPYVPGRVNDGPEYTPDDGRRDRPKQVECCAKINNLRNWCIWLVLL
jgi:hypothetical protein